MSPVIHANERKHFKVGSRKSKLAMAQTESIIGELQKQNPTFTFEIVNFDTVGDKILDKALSKIGDKGLFTKELEDALQDKTIDFVVHSLKDMPCQQLPDDLIISAIPKREDPSDALVMAKRWQHLKSLDELPSDSIIGTSSVRRISQLKSIYPNLRFESIRGNLNTRFKKLDEDQSFDAIILAVAGLKRLNFSDRITTILSSSVSMHAVGQGALGIESRKSDSYMTNILNKLNDEETLLRCIAERAFMTQLNGGCSAPIGINSKIENNKIVLDGVVLSLDGKLRQSDRFETRLDNNYDTSDSCPKAPEEMREPKNLTKNTIELNEMVELFENNELNDSSLKSYTYIVANNIDAIKLEKALFCGMHLGKMLLESGASVLIEQSRDQNKN